MIHDLIYNVLLQYIPVSLYPREHSLLVALVSIF